MPKNPRRISVQGSLTLTAHENRLSKIVEAVDGEETSAQASRNAGKHRVRLLEDGAPIARVLSRHGPIIEILGRPPLAHNLQGPLDELVGTQERAVAARIILGLRLLHVPSFRKPRLACPETPVLLIVVQFHAEQGRLCYLDGSEPGHHQQRSAFQSAAM